MSHTLFMGSIDGAVFFRHVSYFSMYTTKTAASIEKQEDERKIKCLLFITLEFLYPLLCPTDADETHHCTITKKERCRREGRWMDMYGNTIPLSFFLHEMMGGNNDWMFRKWREDRDEVFLHYTQKGGERGKERKKVDKATPKRALCSPPAGKAAHLSFLFFFFFSGRGGGDGSSPKPIHRMLGLRPRSTRKE